MENKKANNFFKFEILKAKKSSFISYFISIIIEYAIIVYLLNTFRTVMPSWLLWILIIIQFTIYFFIFIVGYLRSKVCGFNKYISLLFFILLAFLGRVDNWELFILPLLVIIIFISPAKNIENKNVLRKQN